MDLRKIRVVMIETSHPGNIGAAARSMKTMGLERLHLVNPKNYPCAEATARAAGADDVLSNAVLSETLDQALEGCTLVMGTSARLRSLTWPIVDPREAAEDFSAESKVGEVALIFGTERTGLTNEQMARCHKLINIPTNPDYSSLNVASAVQVLSYELRMHAVKEGEISFVASVEEKEVAPAQNMEGYYQHLEKTLLDVEFINPKNPGQLMPRLRRLYNRARPTLEEVNILRGILTATQKAIRK